MYNPRNSYNDGSSAFMLFFAFLALLVIAGLIGWVMNLVKLIGLVMAPGVFEITNEAVMRIIGLIPVVGAITGWL